MTKTRKGVRSPHADEVDHLIRTTSMTNSQIAKKTDVTLSYVQNRRRYVKLRKTPLKASLAKADITSFDTLINQVFC